VVPISVSGNADCPAVRPVSSAAPHWHAAVTQSVLLKNGSTWFCTRSATRLVCVFLSVTGRQWNPALGRRRAHSPCPHRPRFDILWRAHVARNPTLSAVRLGPHAHKIRAIFIESGTARSDSEYPISCCAPRDRRAHCGRASHGQRSTVLERRHCFAEVLDGHRSVERTAVSRTV